MQYLSRCVIHCHDIYKVLIFRYCVIYLICLCNVGQLFALRKNLSLVEKVQLNKLDIVQGKVIFFRLLLHRLDLAYSVEQTRN